MPDKPVAHVLRPFFIAALLTAVGFILLLATSGAPNTWARLHQGSTGASTAAVADVSLAHTQGYDPSTEFSTVNAFVSLRGVATEGAASGLGDLTNGEVAQIQRVVDEAGRPLEVGGSAAQAARRGVGSDLPIGKDPGTQSDIDYLIPPGSASYYQGLEDQLPGIDQRGPIPGTHNPFIGPGIRFEPGAPPRYIPGQ